MSLTTTNAQIKVQDGAGAAANLNNGGIGFFTPGSLVTFSLQSTTGVARWDLVFNCPGYPALHQRSMVWQQGQANLLQVPMPAAMAATANAQNGIQVLSTVSDGVQSVAQSVAFLETVGLAGPHVARFARVATAAALATYTAAGGVITITATGALAAIDGVTCVAGDRVLLTLGATASDNGLYVVSNAGATGVKATLTRAPEWATGATIQSGSIVEVGPEGTAFPNSTWKVTASANPVVDTTDPALYPKTHVFSKTLSSGAGTVSNVFALATTSPVIAIDTTAAAAVKAVVTAGQGTGSIALAGTTSDVIQGAIVNW